MPDTQDRTEPVRPRPYARLLVMSAGLGIPVSLAAFVFLALLHEIQHQVWDALPETLGYEVPPWWWPLPWLAIAGALVGLAIRSLPGHGGHRPIDGLGMGPVPADHLPGILLAALAGLPLGVVLGPEAPLLAIGSGLALILVRPWDATLDERTRTVLAVVGSAAALSAIFGNPLVGAVFVIEAAGLAGPTLARLVLPCMLASGIGALVFTGMGTWTGLEIASLALPDVDAPVRPDVADVLWAVPLAVAVAILVRTVHRLGGVVAGLAARHPFAVAVGAALVVALCAGCYTVVTGRSPEEVVLSGQLTLAQLAADPGAWGVGALVALLALKSLAYGVSLGALRGGAIFPAILLGAAAGLLAGGLPGFGAVPALAVGMAAATAATLPVPVSAAVLVTMLLGDAAAAMTPIVLVAVVAGYVTEQFVLRPRRAARQAAAAAT
ncbi:chloride channel protein [Isoptericola sp. BMS4]|uniref:chloride channel protein n=1 Tax=Isoptericola sp. BMS4 TaxID=2527875 RepID=UPI001421C7B4|nr:chloride channel protein [Isoptericola sp. BMS4]